MNNDWPMRVEGYLDRVEQVALTIELILDQTKLETSASNAGNVQQATLDLQQALVELEQKVAEREELLAAPDAPIQGTTLADKLSATGRAEDALLGVRCQQVSKMIESTHHQAISIFVCQYHLADLGTELVRLISGADLPATYGVGHEPSPPASGGLFNESA